MKEMVIRLSDETTKAMRKMNDLIIRLNVLNALPTSPSVSETISRMERRKAICLEMDALQPIINAELKRG